MPQQPSLEREGGEKRWAHLIQQNKVTSRSLRVTRARAKRHSRRVQVTRQVTFLRITANNLSYGYKNLRQFVRRLPINSICP
jgi:hypothetical protein